MTTETVADPSRTGPDDTPRAKNLALLLLAMAQFIVVIDVSIVNVALPSIGRHLHFSRTDLSWVVNAACWADDR
jgi:predicted MFS family arabinose efflux permease